MRGEWNEAKGLDWNLLDYEPHRGVWKTVRDLNYLYRSRPALHARDCEPEGFQWLIVDDEERSVFAWLRKAPDGNPIAVITNFTPVPRDNYRVPLPATGRMTRGRRECRRIESLVRRPWRSPPGCCRAESARLRPS